RARNHDACAARPGSRSAMSLATPHLAASFAMARMPSMLTKVPRVARGRLLPQVNGHSTRGLARLMRSSGAAKRHNFNMSVPIVIVGGGFTGAAAAVQLARASATPLDISIVEPRAELGRGVAYS